MNEIFQTIAVLALPVVFAITLHEAAHAYAAKYFGDDTAFRMGRVSLDPLRHIDWLGTIALPILLYWLSHGQFTFGYAKPVPVDFSRLRNPKKQMAFVALAGPAANFVMGFLWLLLLAVSAALGLDGFVSEVAKAGVLVNVVMFVFNLLPIPPLDGGRITVSLLPMKQAIAFSKIEPYGFIIVMALVYTRALDPVLFYFVDLTLNVLHLIALPLTFFLS